MTVAVVEMFGSIGNENIRQDGVTLEDVAVEGLERLQAAGALGEVDTIITGMTHQGDKPVTYALQDAVEELDVDIEVEAFYGDVTNVMEEDDIEYNEAWKRVMNWRNEKLFTVAEDEDDTEQADLAVRFGDAGNNGVQMLNHARQKGVLALDVNLDNLIDRDAAYGGNDDEADEEADAE